MPESAKILVVDDEPDILEFMQYNLEKEGYEVLTAENGKEAVRIARREMPQLVLLDIMMPEQDGIETCKQLREHNELQDTIIAFLTARSEDYTQIAGFEAGADDYVTKPIKPRVLLSRVQALLRRGRTREQVVEKYKIEAGDLEIDRESYVVYKKGKSLSLPKKEFELLTLLVSKPGKVFRREEIMNRIWGTEVIVGDRTIDVHIRKLREKIGDQYFKTVKGIGYKFIL